MTAAAFTFVAELPRFDLEQDFFADYTTSPGAIPYDTRDPETGRYDPLDRYDGMIWSPIHTHTITGDWPDVTATVTANYEGAALWLAPLETVYGNLRYWLTLDKGTNNRGNIDDLDRRHSWRWTPYPPNMYDPPKRHKSSAPGWQRIEQIDLAAGQPLHVHAAYSIEIDKDAGPLRTGEMGPLLKTWRPITTRIDLA